MEDWPGVWGYTLGPTSPHPREAPPEEEALLRLPCLLAWGWGPHWPLQARRPAPQHHCVGQARSKTSAARVQTEGWDLAEDHSFIQIQNSQKPKYCWVFFFFNFQALTANTYFFPLEALFLLLLFPEKEFSCLPFCHFSVCLLFPALSKLLEKENTFSIQPRKPCSWSLSSGHWHGVLQTCTHILFLPDKASFHLKATLHVIS